MPRRAYPAYRALARRLRADGPIGLAVELGAANGLATNAVHFVDLLAFLAGNADGLRLSGAQMVPAAGGSRHAGAAELEGTLSGTLAGGSTLTVRRDAGSEAPISVRIASRTCLAVIVETTAEAVLATADGGPGAPAWALRPMPFELVRQSALTHSVVADIVDRGDCDLPRYGESARIHLACLAAFREVLAPGVAGDVPCPITSAPPFAGSSAPATWPRTTPWCSTPWACPMPWSVAGPRRCGSSPAVMPSRWSPAESRPPSKGPAGRHGMRSSRSRSMRWLRSAAISSPPGARRILVEKPGAAQAGDLQDLAEDAARAGASLWVGYNRRFYESVRRLRALAAEDGGVVSFDFEFTELADRIARTPHAPLVKRN